MERKSLMPADTYIVTSKTILSSEDHKLLSSLYQPIVGSVAISLYFSLWSYLDGSECLSLEWTHHQLMANMKLKLSEIEVARTKLEAIGLLKTYFKEDHINHYVYQLYAPLSSREFFHNPILNTTLQNNVGKKEYEKLVERYQTPKVPLHDHQDITCKFNDVFESVSTYEMNEEDNLKQREKRQLELTSKIDLDHVFSMIPEDYFLVSSVTRDMRDFIYKLSFIYDFDEETLVKILMNSINEKKMIDKDLLRTQARNIYRFENGGKTPTLIYKNEPEAKRVSGKSPLTKKAKLIYQFDIFYQDGMEFDPDDYSNTDTMIFKFHPVNAITTALEEISSMIVDLELDNEEQDEDLQEDNQFCVCCDYLTNQQIVQYLNHQFNELDSDTTCLNLYQYLKITDTEKLVNLVKMVLSTDFVYPDEPISFSYALYKAIKGMI